MRVLFESLGIKNVYVDDHEGRGEILPRSNQVSKLQSLPSAKSQPA